MTTSKDLQDRLCQRFRQGAPRRAERARNLERIVEGRDGRWSEVEGLDRLIERARRMGLTKESRALLEQPQDEVKGGRILELVIGRNDLLSARFLQDGATASAAVARLVVDLADDIRLGTGFLVSPRLLMTNNHVLESEADAVRAAVQFNYIEHANGLVGPTREFRLQPELFFLTDGDLDFTIVAIEERNQAGQRAQDQTWLPLWPQSGKALVGERVNILQHPDGRPQQVAIHENLVVDVLDDWLHYTADTLGGSSGAPVLNDAWELVALHHAAVERSAIDGGDGIVNEGVRVSRIVSRLLELFSEEAISGHRGTLVNELLNPRRPPDEAPPGGQVRASGTAAEACLEVPLRISLAIDATPAPIELVRPPAPPRSAATSQVDPIDAKLQRALGNLEASRTRPYYDEAADRERQRRYYAAEDDGLAAGYRTLHRLRGVISTTHHGRPSFLDARLLHLYPVVDLHEEDRSLHCIKSGETADPAEIIRRESVAERDRRRALQAWLERKPLETDDPIWAELDARYPPLCIHALPTGRAGPWRGDLHCLFTCLSGADGERDEAWARTGALARATLYFVLRYPGELGMVATEDWLQRLVEAHRADPPTRWERHRNAVIADLQGNRNPFVDRPEVADLFAAEATGTAASSAA